MTLMETGLWTGHLLTMKLHLECVTEYFVLKCFLCLYVIKENIKKSSLAP